MTAMPFCFQNTISVLRVQETYPLSPPHTRYLQNIFIFLLKKICRTTAGKNNAVVQQIYSLRQFPAVRFLSRGNEIRIQSLFADKLLMGAALYDMGIAQHQNLVSVSHRL